MIHSAHILANMAGEGPLSCKDAGCEGLPTPYYSRDGITIYHADALVIMPGLEARQFDAIITDPPYGTETDQRPEWMIGEFANIMPLALPLLHRLGTANAAFYCFTSWKHLADWVLRCSSYFRMQNILVWDKGHHSGCYGAFSWQFCWEAIYFGIKGPRRVRKYMPDVLRHGKGSRGAMEKPTAVIAQLIEASTDRGDLILDPFMGSGTTLRAAKDLGRRAIGIEIEEKYCEIAVKRLAQEVLL
jgi:DNA modification methylase